MFWTISAVVIALISLVVNILQYLANKKLKKEIINKTIQKTEDHSEGIQQTHSGKGNNVNIKGNVDIGKS